MQDKAKNPSNMLGFIPLSDTFQQYSSNVFLI